MYSDTNTENQIKPKSNEEKIQNIVNCIRPYILRRDPQLIESVQAPRAEYIVKADLSPMQVEYSKILLELNQSSLKYGSQEPMKLQSVIVQLKKVCNHPFMLKDFSNATLDEIISNSGKF